jgi:hypothetical protein
MYISLQAGYSYPTFIISLIAKVNHTKGGLTEPQKKEQ